jgi:hypothetical protein
MTEATSRQDGNGNDGDIVLVLNDLRDQLVDLAMVMRDFMFEVDFIHRNEAAQLSRELLKKVKEMR